MDNKMEQQELISALADGQVRGEAFARAAQAVAADPAARRTWHTYHLIGDVLRSAQPTAATAPEPFVAKLAARLAQERPYAIENVADRAEPVRAEGQFDTQRHAANDGSFRWKLVAGFASLAAVAAVGWSLASVSGARPEQAQLAGAQPAAGAPVLASGEQGLMIRDGRLDELLAAHRQFGGASALQMPAGFLRNATFEGSGR
jgi:sigma-E factor negative regulatory protein RseA